MSFCKNCGDQFPIIADQKNKIQPKIYSKECLQDLREETDKERRLEFIDTIVNILYNKVIETARTTNNQIIYYEIASTNYSQKDINENIPEIINSLRHYFPECYVKYTSLIPSQHGISTSPFDNQEKDYIVIDWS